MELSKLEDLLVELEESIENYESCGFRTIREIKIDIMNIYRNTLKDCKEYRDKIVQARETIQKIMDNNISMFSSVKYNSKEAISLTSENIALEYVLMLLEV